MRFLVSVLAAAGFGALAVVAMQTMLPQHSASVATTVRALTADATQLRLSDLHPITAAFEDVKQKITSGQSSAPLNLRAPAPIAFSGPITLPKPIEIDRRAIDRAVAAGINSRIQQDYQRSQAIMQYGRNPMAWRGPPPR